MPLMRLIAENIGPFERLDIDFSDGNGKPHLGPHILAGVNGSGKSTALRAIAWALSSSKSGFPEEEWKHFLKGPKSRAIVHVAPEHSSPYIVAVTARFDRSWEEPSGLATSLGLGGPSDTNRSPTSGASWARFGKSTPGGKHPFTMCAYAPARALSYVVAPGRLGSTYLEHLAETSIASIRRPTDDCLGFESTVQNRAIQRWLVDLFSRRALAKERGQEFEPYEQTLTRFQDALKLVCDDPEIRVDVELGPIIEPRVNFHGKTLNFSQLSDGVRTTIGWLADFMMRQDQTEATNGAKAGKEGLLLLDEIDIYLHPRWQRTLLPAMRKALPDVQIIASSHSPFVISSCADARIHVLTIDDSGVAHAQAPQDAPFGESVTATLRGIFGVESRFDAQTERDLKDWDNLKREEAVGKLTPARRGQLESLSGDLSERSEELRLIVKSPSALQASLLNALVSHQPQERPQSRPPKGNGNRAPRSAKPR
jgi:energy-coupling factor transporter ATP-binding protein EcfA2